MKKLLFLIAIFTSLTASPQEFPAEVKSTFSVSVRLEPNNLSRLLVNIPSNKKFTILDFAGEHFYKVQYKEFTGYSTDESLLGIKSTAIKEVIKNTETLNKKRKEEKAYKMLVENFGEENALLLTNQIIKKGMTLEMVRFAMGDPDEISTMDGGYKTYIYNNFKGYEYSIDTKDEVVINIYQTTVVK